MMKAGTIIAIIIAFPTTQNWLPPRGAVNE
jgi:hypothetical protein